MTVKAFPAMSVKAFPMKGQTAYQNAGLGQGSKGGVLVVQAQPGQQAEYGEGQLVLGVPKQGSKAMIGPALPLSLLHNADAGHAT